MGKVCNVKKVLAVMALILGCLFVLKPNVAQASSVKKYSIYKGCYKVLTVNTSDDVKWSVSGNKCVKIIKSKGDNKVLIIAKKAGKAKVTAKYGSKKSTWSITVKNDKTSHLSLKKATVKKDKVIIETVANLYSGKKNFDFEYGRGYQLYKYADGKWKEIQFVDDLAFDSSARVVSLKKNSKEKVNIKYILPVSHFKNWNMESGVYKLVAVTNLSTGKEYVLFEISK